MTDKSRANRPETVEEAVKPVASEKPKGTQTTVEGVGELMTKTGSKSDSSMKSEA